MAIDYETLFGLDEYDPCEAVRAIRPVLMELRVEGGIKTIQFRDRKTEFSPPDIDNLQALLSQMERECAEKTGGRIRRRAITVGVRCDR